MHKHFGLILLLLCGLSSANAQELSVSIDDSWARWQSDDELAVYMTLQSKHADQLLGITSPLAESSALYTHVVSNGSAQKRRVNNIELPAKLKVRLEPGGLHAILHNFAESPAAGQLLPLILRFGIAPPINLTTQVLE